VNDVLILSFFRFVVVLELNMSIDHYTDRGSVSEEEGSLYSSMGNFGGGTQ
jgi:hypothetical protein